MKKMLALVLVLAMASLASADLTGYDVAGADSPTGLGAFTITATPGNLTGPGGYWALMPTTQGATLTNATINTGDTADASGFFGDSAGTGILAAGGIWGFIGSYGTLNVPVDTVLVSALTGTEAVAIDLLFIADDFSGTTYVDTYSLVPEPITMSLLGLGGLFLRRRKK